ncbi:Tim17/Tim22/Tim23/Pmp24 family-domain-containing protein [Lipomyces arxii]|uniref:Tim17/Tim22/Tim23/Pmp24 family-domain-containing protein n=1 Tax=Lipomyces arxii TaxID=56418 RepID=UPI0034CD1E5B
MVWPFGGTKSNEDSSSSIQSTTSESTQQPPQQLTQVEDDVPDFLKQSFDVTKLHPLAGLDQGLEVLDLEDDALSEMPGSQGVLPSRGWTDDLCYGTGTMYMSGLTIGGTYGFMEGMRTSPANAPARLRINTILNSITRRGPFLGNTAGVLAVSYNVFNGILDQYRNYHDIYNSVSAGLVTGILYSSARGIKQMAISGAIMGTATGVWSFISGSV